MYGFECRTESGNELLISTDYESLHLLSDSISYVGTAKMPSPGTSWTPTWHKFSIYYPFNTPPLPFINLAVDESAVMSGLNKNGNNWEFLVIAATGSWNTSRSALSASTILGKLYCFGKRSTYSSGGNGLKVFSDNGSVNFSSRDNPLWITTFSQFTNVTITSATYHSECVGSMNGAHTYPIFHTPVAAAQPFPFITSYALVGWKRTDASTFTSYRMSANVPTSGTVRSSFVLVADLVT
jgi:hypothetical protein